MKNKSLLFAVSLALIGCLLGSCKADVDLGNIEPEMGLSLGLALPVGEISATIGDFIGNETVSQYIKVDNDGILYFQDTFQISRPFHPIDLTQYMSSVNHKFDVGSEYGGFTLRKGRSYPLTFPLVMQLNNINSVFDNERIDSIWIREAKFTSNFDVTNFPLRFRDIQKVEIKLDDQFTRPSGKKLEVPLPSNGRFGMDIPIDVDEFYINLMKDRKALPSNRNVVNEVGFEFIFTVVPEEDIVIPSNALIDYDFRIDFLQYHAVWGVFAPSNKMEDEDTICIADQWEKWNDISKLKLPLAEPEVTVDIYNSIGAPLTLDGKYLYVKGVSDPEPTYATFNGKTNKLFDLIDYVRLTDPIDKVVKNTILFNKDIANGHIDQLFDTRPDSVGFAFQIYVNNTYAQANDIHHYRLSENIDIDLDAIIKLPFTFNAGLEVAYTDTVDSINISSFQIDSLIAEVEAIEEVEINDLKLIINATNTIPFEVHGELQLLDEANKPLNFNLTTEGNELTFAGPTEVENGVIVKPGVSTFIISVNQDKYDELTRLKKMVFTANLGKNTTYVRVLDRSGLKLRVAVAADVSAVANLDGLFNSNNEEVVE